jgi:hypothetical protein
MLLLLDRIHQVAPKHLLSYFAINIQFRGRGGGLEITGGFGSQKHL